MRDAGGKVLVEIALHYQRMIAALRPGWRNASSAPLNTPDHEQEDRAGHHQQQPTPGVPS